MAAVLTYGAALPVLKVGRIAGQFVKPRSHDTEETPERRDPRLPRPHDPRRRAERRRAHPGPGADARRAITTRAATLNLVRAFTKGGFADLTQVHAWNQDFVASSPQGRPLRGASRRRSSARSRSWPPAASTSRRRRSCTRSTSGRATKGLLLDYEEALTRRDSITRRLVRLLGAHALDRRAHARRSTAHTSSSSPAFTIRSAARSARRRAPTRSSSSARGSNPDRVPGPADADHAASAPSAVAERAAAASARGARGRPSGRLDVRPDARERRCAPRAGTRRATSTRSCREIEGFFAACRAEGIWPGGVHLEYTGDRRHRMPRRLRGARRGAARRTATRRSATRA